MSSESIFGLIDFFNQAWVDWPTFMTADLRGVYTTPPFPPTDVKLDKESKDIIFDFAVAGYSDEDIDINFSGDYIILKINDKESTVEDKFKPIHNGIRRGDINFRYYVPGDKYDQDNVEANLSNGILTVKVPARKEEQKKKIKINK